MLRKPRLDVFAHETELERPERMQQHLKTKGVSHSDKVIKEYEVNQNPETGIKRLIVWFISIVFIIGLCILIVYFFNN